MNKELKRQVWDFLKNQGFELGAHNLNFKTMHSIGLPQRTFVPIKPDYAPVDGGAVILVMFDCLEMWTITIPYADNVWTLHSRVQYAHKEEMVGKLKDFISEPTGPWGS